MEGRIHIGTDRHKRKYYWNGIAVVIGAQFIDISVFLRGVFAEKIKPTEQGKILLIEKFKDKNVESFLK